MAASQRLLSLAQKASGKTYVPGEVEDTSSASPRVTVDLFFKFLTSKTGLFLKTPLVHELAEAIDGMYSILSVFDVLHFKCHCFVQVLQVLAKKVSC